MEISDDEPVDIKAGGLMTDFITRKYGNEFQCWGVHPLGGEVFDSPMHSVLDPLRKAAPEGYKLWRISITFFDDVKKLSDINGKLDLSFDFIGDVPESYMMQIEDL